MQSLSMDDFYSGEGTDNTGVPTKLVTVNCSLKINVYNSAPLFGIHVTSGPINLMYSKITIATGQVSVHIFIFLVGIPPSTKNNRNDLLKFESCFVQQ